MSGRIIWINFKAPISILERNAVIWCNFLNILQSRFWGRWCWMKFGLLVLRLWPQKFVIIFESLAADLKKVRQTSIWQTVPDFWFICLFYCSSKTYNANAKRKISMSNESELWNHLSYRGLPYLFDVGIQTFKNHYKFSRS